MATVVLIHSSIGIRSSSQIGVPTEGHPYNCGPRICPLVSAGGQVIWQGGTLGVSRECLRLGAKVLNRSPDLIRVRRLRF
ncbi:hypothetical protein BH20ACI3_BH20ACI3_27570 [soil metagenome]